MLMMTASHIFRAKPELPERLAEWCVDISGYEEDVLGPTLWSNSEGKFTDSVPGLKLLFLARIRQLASEFHAPALTALPLTTESFDRYWEIESFKGPSEVAAEVFRELESTGGLRDADADTRRAILDALSRSQ